eukprot:scaffold880_cov132-Cylindrotheca_fusiformis.AAC.67
MGRPRARLAIREYSCPRFLFTIVVLSLGFLPLILHQQLSPPPTDYGSTFEHKLAASASGVSQSIPETKKNTFGKDKEVNRLAGLNCDRWGGPSNDAAKEMVYWEDIPSDSEFLSPFHKENGKTQYFTFEPDHAGFNNVRMSMETILSSALAMGRTLVLPPAQELHMLSSSDDEQKNEFSFNDFFPMESISSEHKGFSIIPMEEYLNLFLEGKLKHPHTGESIFPPGNRTNWDGCNRKELKVLHTWLRESSKRLAVNHDDCLLSFPRSSDPKAMEELEHIQDEIKAEGFPKPEEFVGKPTPVDAPPKDRLRENLASRKKLCLYDRELQESTLVHFPLIRGDGDKSRMLIHFYAFLFFADWKMDLWMKRFVRDHVRYVDELQCTAARIVDAIRKRVLSRSGGESKDFDTIHVRRGDFQDQYETTEATVEDIYKMMTQRIPDNTTVYIATDEEDENFFRLLRDHYDIVFLEDFKDELGEINSNFYGMIDQLVASRGRVFFGCWFSTFTGYINRLRGYHTDNKKSPGYDMGIIPSYYYVPKGNFLSMQKFYPVKRSVWAREFPTSWRLIDKGLSDFSVQ